MTSEVFVRVLECNNCNRLFHPDDEEYYCYIGGCDGILRETWVFMAELEKRGWTKRWKDEEKE